MYRVFASRRNACSMSARRTQRAAAMVAHATLPASRADVHRDCQRSPPSRAASNV
ncbi:hypothetical protein BUH_7081 [Burkholderia pseudomallei Pakistan 9]|nr:hypothetical protein BUH_7081 [Burkholderia pseudomallei Pakistan 9]